jgi:ribosome-binding protein aMBF1 (putative translation factor)
LVVDDEREASGLSDVELADELEAQVLHLRVVDGG